MNSGDLLVDLLSRLDTDTRDDNDDDVPVRVPDDPGHPSTPGYGFRTASGLSSPSAPPDRKSPLPDVNGLGWPGVFSFSLLSLHTIHSPVKQQSKVHPLSPQRVPRRDCHP